jgi:hypothetical protein
MGCFAAMLSRAFGGDESEMIVIGMVRTRAVLLVLVVVVGSAFEKNVSRGRNCECPLFDARRKNSCSLRLPRRVGAR